MYPYVNWKNQTVKEDYIAQIAILSKSIIPPVDIADVASTGDVQMYINEYCNNIVDVMHRAAKKRASENFKVKQSKQKAKHWWNADCPMQETDTGFGLAYGSHVVVPERGLCSTPTNTPNIGTEKFAEIE